MNGKKISNKRLLVWISAFVGLFLLSAAIIFYLSNAWKPIVEKEIREAVLTSTDSLYTINFDDINLNLFTGTVAFKNLEFKADRTVFDKLKKSLKAPNHLFYVKIDGLTLKKVHPWQIYFRKHLKMNAIVIENPQIKVFFENTKQPDSSGIDRRTAYQRLSKFLKGVEIQTIDFFDVDFAYIDKSYKKPRVDRVSNVEITVKDLLIDSVAHLDRTRFYYTKDISVNVRDHTYKTRDGMYTLKFKDLTASTAGRFAKLENFKVMPNYPEIEFSKKYKFQKDRFSMNFKEILLSEIDFKELNIRRKLVGRKLRVRNSLASIFVNRELPPANFDKGINFPHTALQRFELNTLIDTISIQNVDVRYTEYNPKTLKKGTIFFNRLNGTVLNVTNDSLALSRNNRCKAHLSTLLMGRGGLKLNINFNLTDPAGAFSFSGELGEFNLKALNSLTRPLGLLEVRSGLLKKADFSVDANRNYARGSIKMLYEDLKIRILGMNEEKKTIKTKGLASLVANTLIIEDSNPGNDGILRTGKIEYIRPKTASFFSLMWKSVFVGVKQTVGLSGKKEERLREQLKKMNSSESNDRAENRRKKRADK